MSEQMTTEPMEEDKHEQGFESRAPIGNYYGSPTLLRLPNRWVLFIRDVDDDNDEVEVSNAFAQAWIREFGGER